MHIIAEDRIPYLPGTLETTGATVTYLPANQITHQTLLTADALITRTRTRCDRTLLHNTPCRFIATATIGTDHIDLDYCKSQNITIANAPGCNAPAVAQWVIASIIAHFGTNLHHHTIGIIGAGHIGTLVDQWAQSLGMQTLLCDPPLAATATDPRHFVNIDEIARRADIITFHTPLTATGPHPTLHLLNHNLINQLTRRPLILNAARGPITSTEALLTGLERHRISAIAIDCWEDEPAIHPQLLNAALIATPHIAGYSRQGKIRATAMAVQALCTHFGITPVPTLPIDLPPAPPKTITPDTIAYDPTADTAALKAAPNQFEHLRNNYHLRNEPLA